MCKKTIKTLFFAGGILMISLLLETDTLNQGRQKINAAIEQTEQALTSSNNAEEISDNAVAIANAALDNSINTQEQLNTVVIEGDSSVESAQARIEGDGTSNVTLKARLDKKDAQFIASLEDKVGMSEKGIANGIPTLDASGKIPTAQFPDSIKTGGIESNLYTFNITNGLKQWKENVSSTLKNVIIMGDSISVGYYADDIAVNGYAALTKSKLQSIFGNGGAGFYMPSDELWIFTGTWNAFTSYGPNGTCKYATGATNKAVITLTGNNFDIYVNGAPDRGTFSVQIDSGTVQTFTPGTTQATEKFNVTTAVNGTHTITITAPSTGNVYLIGVSANIGTTGCRVYNVAKSGGVVNDMAYGYHKDFIVPMDPDLTIIAYTTNNFSNQTVLSDYKTQLEALIIKAKLSGDVLLISNCQMYATGKTIPQKDYEAVLMQLAVQYNCGFISIYDRWVNYDNATLLGYMYDVNHPNTNGHADQAKAVIKCLID